MATVVQHQRQRGRDVARRLEAEKQAALAEYAAEEEHMKKAKQQKTADKKAARQAGPKRDDLVVFAFRLPKGDRDLIHTAAGPGKASSFGLAAILAAATADKKAFDALAEQAKTNRK